MVDVYIYNICMYIANFASYVSGWIDIDDTDNNMHVIGAIMRYPNHPMVSWVIAERRDALGRKAEEQGTDMRMQRQILEIRGNWSETFTCV